MFNNNNINNKMKLFNLTNSVLSIPLSLGNDNRISIQPRTVSDNIVLTQNIVKSSLLPLINLYGDKILITANTSDRLVLDTPGFGIPMSNVVDEKTGTKKLNQAINIYNKQVRNKNKQVQPQSEPKKDNPRDDLKAGIPNEANKIEPENVIVPEVKVIPGNK